MIIRANSNKGKEVKMAELDPIIRDLRNANNIDKQQESCIYNRRYRYMGLLILLILVLFLIPQKLGIWPAMLSQALVITVNAPYFTKKRTKSMI